VPVRDGCEREGGPIAKMPLPVGATAPGGSGRGVIAATDGERGSEEGQTVDEGR
jgi:hypothetical protein